MINSLNLKMMQILPIPLLYIFLPGSVPQYGIGVIPKDEVQE